MGGMRKLTPKDRGLLQLVAIVVLALLPVILVAIILYGLVGVISAIFGQGDIMDALGSTGGGIAMAVLLPFRTTFDNCRHLVKYLRRSSLARQGSASNNSDGIPYQLLAHRKPYQSCRLWNADQFRILVISPASFDEPLRGELVVSNFSTPYQPQYDALSYTWADETGDTTRAHEFLLEGEKGSILITKNCEAAIRRLRHTQHQRWVWIDAICIDQDSDTERTYQVSIMSKIYTSARNVVVYTGEGTPETDRLFDWLNGLKTADLDIPSSGDQAGNLAEDVAVKLERYWSIGRENLMALVRGPGAHAEAANMSESDLIRIITDFFSRRWFRRVWVLQEVSLPDPRNTTVMCGARSVSAMRALHLLSLLRKHPAAAMMRIFVLVRNAPRGHEKSHLLDILIEARGREAGEPRDKIFGLLSIAKLLDKGRFPELEADYSMTTQQVYARYSSFFIRHHGPGLFLSLIKSRPELPGLPSWAADWIVPWPNYKAVAGRDLAAATRSANNNKDTSNAGVIFTNEDGFAILTLVRPRILQGYFTRSGHIDESDKIDAEKVESLGEGQVLIEMYPGLAALLAKKPDHYTFVQTCPHALSEAGVEELVARWSSVVVDAEGPKHPGTSEYLGPVETFKLR